MRKKNLNSCFSKPIENWKSKNMYQNQIKVINLKVFFKTKLKMFISPRTCVLHKTWEPSEWRSLVMTGIASISLLRWTMGRNNSAHNDWFLIAHTHKIGLHTFFTSITFISIFGLRLKFKRNLSISWDWKIRKSISTCLNRTTLQVWKLHKRCKG